MPLIQYRMQLLAMGIYFCPDNNVKCTKFQTGEKVYTKDFQIGVVQGFIIKGNSVFYKVFIEGKIVVLPESFLLTFSEVIKLREAQLAKKLNAVDRLIKIPILPDPLSGKTTVTTGPDPELNVLLAKKNKATEMLEKLNNLIPDPDPYPGKVQLPENPVCKPDVSDLLAAKEKAQKQIDTLEGICPIITKADIIGCRKGS